MPYRNFLRWSNEGPRLALIMCVSLASACGGPEPVTEPVALTDAADSAAMRSRVTVSGLSAGGYMAVQAHIALADRIGGVAAIAAGPYHCAQGSVGTALSLCLSGTNVDATPFVNFARDQAAAGHLADAEHLSGAPVWLFRGARDAVINADVTTALADFYRTLAPTARVLEVKDIDAAHGWPTLDHGEPCAQRGGDYLNACDYDAAGALLTHLYGNLQPPASDVAAPEELDVSALLPDGTGIADTAYVFIPEQCRSAMGECRLHIAFHGCRQGAQFVDARFASGNGLNRWAAANDIVVLYPQIEKSMTNPQGCWDWWGYSGADYDQRSGKQIRAVAAFIDAWHAGGL